MTHRATPWGLQYAHSTRIERLDAIRAFSIFVRCYCLSVYPGHAEVLILTSMPMSAPCKYVVTPGTCGMRLGHVYASVRYAACEVGAALARASQREWVGDAHRAEAGRVERVFGRDDVVDLPPARPVVGARVARSELVQLECRLVSGVSISSAARR